MHEELIDTSTFIYLSVLFIDLVSIFCCIYLAKRETFNSVVYRVGLVLLSFGLMFQVARSVYFLHSWDIPYALSMGWALKDLGIFICLAMIVLLRRSIKHNER